MLDYNDDLAARKAVEALKASRTDLVVSLYGLHCIQDLKVV